MRVVWAQGDCTVRSVREQLEHDRSRPLAYTTVMTILARLHERGLLSRSKVGRGYVYRARSDERAMLHDLSDLAVDRLLEQYGTAALRRFAEHLSELEPSLRAELIKLADGTR
jgi:predicted transcriptional regulator